jgi:hypothetical protein
MSCSTRPALRGAFLIALAFALLAPAARALPPECPTYFPDFRCGRHGRYEGFVPPMMHPYLFEDPFITTGVSLWGLWHEFPNDSILDGGHLWDTAVQARLAVTDRIALVATKDGWVKFEPGLDLLGNAQGMTDITFGVKAAVVDLPEVPFILTPGLRFELTNGSRDVLQGNGDGVFIPSVSAAWGLDRFHVIGDVGMQVPIDTDKNSTSIFYHLHLDYAVHRFFVPFVEIGGFYYTDGGDGSASVKLDGGADVPLGLAQALLGEDPEEGYDYANLGSRGVAGHSVVAGSVGVRVPITKHFIFGMAYEYPLSPSRDVLKQRASANLTIEF